MAWMATENVVDALGISDSVSITAISRAFSFLGITASRHRPGAGDGRNNHRLSIALDGATVDNASHAEFDFTSKTWAIKDLHTKSSLAERPRRDPSLMNTRVLGDEEDWTSLLPQTDHVRFVLSRDWPSSPLGPMRTWPISLRLMTSKMLADPRAACLYWGEERVAIYNEPFVEIAYSRHPFMMGAPARLAMPATWPFLSQIFLDVEHSGNAFSCPAFEMMVHKEKDAQGNDFLEEAWYDATFSPVRGLDGSIEGFYNSGYEITRLTLMDRMSRLIHNIVPHSDFRGKTVWNHIRDECEPFDRDVSMLILYSAHTKETSQTSSCTLNLEGCLGLPEGHQAIPNTLDLNLDHHGFTPAFRVSRAHGSYITLDTPGFLDGVKWRGFDEPSHVIAVIPIFVTGLIAGFVVLGLNSRRPFNEGQKQFVEDMGRVATAVVSENVSFEQARAREAQLMKELTNRERFIRKLAQVATVGIYSTTADGAITYANTRFYDINGLPQQSADDQNMSFLDGILAEDKHKLRNAFDECRVHKSIKSIDVRLRRKWTPPGSTIEQDCWILNSMTPNMEDGKVVGVIGCITDISHSYYALELQKNSAKAAEEAREKQERFIDVTSHEMRNPLGAVMQCADDIHTLVERAKEFSLPENMIDNLNSIDDNTQTISFCTSHQKRIIDDILTVSKLDSNLLTITPVLEEPSKVAQTAMKMFEAEFLASDIVWTSRVEPSYNIKWAYCDPTRLTQILINLFTNSIKFTKTSEKREIHLTVGISTDAPPANMNELRWFPKQPRALPEVCTKDEIFLTFKVSDTGAGLKPDEMSRLFNRFAQGSHMTHTKYGGSGLGLFISRELTELQGGLMGATSISGKGSTFGLYIKARKASPFEIQSQKRGSRPASSVPPPKVNKTSDTQKSSNPDEKLHILVVEDNLLNQKVLTKQLQRLGCTVNVANHGLEALDFIKSTRFWRDNNGAGINLTVILMDWEMPVCDGLTATRRLREMEQKGLVTERSLIIATTANARAEQIQMAFDAGVDDLLAKPFTVKQVMEKINGA